MTEQPQGKALGGSSTINGSAFIAPSQAGIDAWAKLGNPKWTYDALLPYYKKVYSIQPPDADVCKDMGIDRVSDTDTPSSPGPIQVSFPALAQKNPMARAWNVVFKDMGYPATADLFPTETVGNRCYTAAIDPQTGKRSSADSRYGGPAFKRSNVIIISEATVLKVLFEGTSNAEAVARGVEVFVGGETFSITANKEVILSAGTFHTAKLLELSGVGDASLLSSLGIPLVIENSNVGGNLQNHVMSVLTLELNDGVEIGDGIQTLAFLPLHDPAAQKDLFDNSAPLKPNEKDFYHIVRSIFDSPDEASCSMFMTFIGLPNFASLGVMQSIPFSHGSSHITSADPFQKPRIDPRFFSNSLDLDIMALHLQTLNQLASTHPLSGYFKKGGQRLPPSAPISDLESAKKYLGENALTTHHPCGTAAMLPREKGGVVDQNLFVYGTSNLRIVDASVFPVISQANPMTTVYAVAERAAELIQESGTRL